MIFFSCQTRNIPTLKKIHKVNFQASESPIEISLLSVSGLPYVDTKLLKMPEVHDANSCCAQSMETSLNSNENRQTRKYTSKFLETRKALRGMAASGTQVLYFILQLIS